MSIFFLEGYTLVKVKERLGDSQLTYHTPGAVWRIPRRTMTSI